MTLALPEAGAPSQPLMEKVSQWWFEAIAAAGTSADEFDLTVPLMDRIRRARQLGFTIGTAYSRFSTKFQDSTDDQLRSCAEAAARGSIYLAPEFLCVDEAKSGRRKRRAGLERLKVIIASRHADVLVLFKLSRLFRKAHQSYRFIEEEVVERGLRAISVTQHIDTDDEASWRLLVGVFGSADEAQVAATADHVRAGQRGLFEKGIVTGAVGVGFKAEIVPDGPLTNRGLPRRRYAIDEDAAKHIRKHFGLIADGMPIAEGLRRWIKDGGPCDPRSTTGHMSYEAYRRLLSNERLRGVFSFGRKRNKWMSSKDYTAQVEQPESEFKTIHFEHLRIVDDETFFKVQERLNKEKRGRHKGRRKPEKPVQLWDLVTDAFFCPACDRRLTQFGSDGLMMHCPEVTCSQHGSVRRKDATLKMADKVGELLLQDEQIVAEITRAAIQLDSTDDGQIGARIATLERQVTKFDRQVDFILRLGAEGSAEDQAENAGALRAARAERAGVKAELARLRTEKDRPKDVITPDRIREILADFRRLLESGASGELGPDNVYRAASIFRALVGGRIDVHFVKRPKRKRPEVLARFKSTLINTVLAELGSPSMDVGAPGQVEVWLRRSTLDERAEVVKCLYDDQKLTFDEIAAQLGCHREVVRTAYLRWFEMRGLPEPQLDYNNGRTRKPRKSA